MCQDAFANSCAKCMLWVVNSLVWASGAALMAIGIWVAVSPQTFVANALNVIGLSTQNNTYALNLSEYMFTNNQLMIIGAYVMIVVGAFLFLVGFCGCCGAQKSSKCLLSIYAIVCGVCFLLALAAGIIEVVYQNQMGTFITAGFVTLQQKRFDALYNSTDPLSMTWYLVMQYSQCCGVNGQGDFLVNASTMATKWDQSNRVTSSSNAYFYRAMLPASCCKQTANGTLVDPTCVIAGSTANSFTASCQTAAISTIISTFQKYSTIVMGVTFGLSGVCVLAIVAAAILMHDIRSRAPERA